MLTTGRRPVDAAKGEKPGPISSCRRGIGGRARAAFWAQARNQVEAPGDGDTKRPETRVVAIGDSDFAANRFLGPSGSRDLFLTSRLARRPGEHDRDPPREAQDRRLAMTADQERCVMWLKIIMSLARSS